MDDDVARDMLEEFRPPVPRTLATCNVLRRAGYKPYARVSVYGRTLELISMPFPQDGVSRRASGISIMAREPDDPTTMFEWAIPNHVVRAAMESFG